MPSRFWSRQQEEPKRETQPRREGGPAKDHIGGGWSAGDWGTPMAPALGPTYPVHDEEARRYGTSGNAPRPQPRGQQRPPERPVVPPTAPRQEATPAAPVTGRGPRGYSRSDQRIFEDLCARIVDAGIDASETELQVKQGVARLEGTVLTRDDKWTLEDIATDVPGVVEVENRLYVRRQGADVTGR